MARTAPNRRAAARAGMVRRFRCVACLAAIRRSGDAVRSCLVRRAAATRCRHAPATRRDPAWSHSLPRRCAACRDRARGTMTLLVGLVAQLLHVALIGAAAPTLIGLHGWLQARLAGRV